MTPRATQSKSRKRCVRNPAMSRKLIAQTSIVVSLAACGSAQAPLAVQPPAAVSAHGASRGYKPGDPAPTKENFGDLALGVFDEAAISRGHTGLQVSAIAVIDNISNHEVSVPAGAFSLRGFSREVECNMVGMSIAHLAPGQATMGTLDCAMPVQDAPAHATVVFRTAQGAAEWTHPVSLAYAPMPVAPGWVPAQSVPDFPIHVTGPVQRRANEHGGAEIGVPVTFTNPTDVELKFNISFFRLNAPAMRTPNNGAGSTPGWPEALHYDITMAPGATVSGTLMYAFGPHDQIPAMANLDLGPDHKNVIIAANLALPNVPTF